MFRKGIYAIIIFILFFSVAAYGARLVWDANTETDLAGYKVYRGQSSGSYDHNVDVGNITEHQIGVLAPGTYYYAVTAYNTLGGESGYSNEVIYTQGLEEIDPATDVRVVWQEKIMPILYDTSNSGSSLLITNTVSLTIGNNDNRILVAGIGWEGVGLSITIASITFNGVAMTLIDKSEFVTTSDYIALYYLLAPDIGTHDLVVTFSTAVASNLGAVSIYNAAQIPPEASAKNSGSSTTCSVNITTLVDGAWVIDGAGTAGGSNVLAPTSGQTKRWYKTQDMYVAGGTIERATAGLYAATWSVTPTREWGIVAGAFKPYVPTLEQKAFRGINRGIARGAM